MGDLVVRAATRNDLDQILALVGGAGLVTTGVAEHIDGFFVADDRGAIVGSAGLETHDGVALLRSVAVAPALRGQGVGARLVRAALGSARERGIREDVDPRLLSSGEFTSPSCATAVMMAIPLRDDEEVGA